MQALIGHTGFVGGHLLAQAGGFDRLYNSRNIGELAGSFELLVCAGVRAEKWLANKEPRSDWQGIERLIDCLGRVRVRELILISTVDVFRAPCAVDEDAPIELDGLHAYGRNRFLLERFVQDRFATRIVRLPGLFGSGLKKNVVFDLLHGNQVERIDPGGVFQFYDLRRLWDDIERVRQAGLKLAHLVTEPVAVGDLAREAFGIELRQTPQSASPRYDVRTRYNQVLGGERGYLQDCRSVLAGLREFVGAHPARGRSAA